MPKFSAKHTAERHRASILLVWLAGFVVNFLLVLYADVTQYSASGAAPAPSRGAINALYSEVLTLYGPYIASMLGIIVATRRQTAVKSSSSLVAIAVTLSAMVNLMLIYQTLRVTCFHTLYIDDLEEWLHNFYLKTVSLLVSGWFAFYFSSGRPGTE